MAIHKVRHARGEGSKKVLQLVTEERPRSCDVTRSKKFIMHMQPEIESHVCDGCILTEDVINIIIIVMIRGILTLVT